MSGDVPDVMRGKKAVADFLQVSVKTVDRWERLYRLPLRRTPFIFALRDELVAWLKRFPTRQ